MSVKYGNNRATVLGARGATIRDTHIDDSVGDFLVRQELLREQEAARKAARRARPDTLLRRF